MNQLQNVVIDSSVIVKWLNQDNELDVDQADKILHDVQSGKIELFAPELAKYEIGNVLLHGKRLTPLEAITPLRTAYALPITFVTESIESAQDTFSLASRLGITYYDATFLSLARQYNASLVTENMKHQGKDTTINVIPLKDY
jgi:predicted nucleic acid-binding protein